MAQLRSYITLRALYYPVLYNSFDKSGKVIFARDVIPKQFLENDEINHIEQIFSSYKLKKILLYFYS